MSNSSIITVKASLTSSSMTRLEWTSSFLRCFEVFSCWRSRTTLGSRSILQYGQKAISPFLRVSRRTQGWSICHSGWNLRDFSYSRRHPDIEKKSFRNNKRFWMLNINYACVSYNVKHVPGIEALSLYVAFSFKICPDTGCFYRRPLKSKMDKKPCSER